MVYQHQMIWQFLSIRFTEDHYISLFRLQAVPNTNSESSKSKRQSRKAT